MKEEEEEEEEEEEAVAAACANGQSGLDIRYCRMARQM